jgi:predicted dehydrogenase/nucleoside-diphosphate-sugar epimerase
LPSAQDGALVTPSTMRAALIGCGQIARSHVNALETAPAAELVAVCDRDRQKAAAVAAMAPGCAVYTDVPALLREERPDVVHVLTPPEFHAPLAIQAVEAGCHVLVEKPFALSLEEADAMLAAGRANGVAVVPNHNYLLKPSVLKARNLIAAGAIGDVVMVDSYYGLSDEGDSFAGAGGAHWAYRLPGGIFTNFVPHLIYLQRQFLGGIESVAGVSVSGGNEASELAVLLRGSAGMGVMKVSTRVRPYAKYVRIFGTKGIVHADLVSEVTTIHRQRRLPRLLTKALFNLEEIPQLTSGTMVNTAKVLTGAMRNMPDLHNLARELYSGLAAGTPLPVTGEDGRANVQVMEHIWAQMPAAPPVSASPRGAEQPGARTAVECQLASGGELRGKKVLVTGAAGFLGRHLAGALRRCGAEVRVLVRDSTRVSFELEREAEVLEGSVDDRASVGAAVEGVDLVFHCAAVTTNNIAWEVHQKTNIEGTQIVLEEALQAGVERLVHVSSIIVYGVGDQRNGKLVSETDSYGEDADRWAYYLRSKLAGDRLALKFGRETRLPVTVVRPGVLYGSGLEGPLKKGLIQLGSFRLTVGRPTNSIPLTYVDNVVDGLLLAATVPQAAGEAYNLVDDPQLDVHTAADRAAALTGEESRLVPVPKPLLEMAARWLERQKEREDADVPPRLSRFQIAEQACDLRFDAGKARRELGWRPEVGLEDGMRRTLLSSADAGGT